MPETMRRTTTINVRVRPAEKGLADRVREAMHADDYSEMVRRLILEKAAQLGIT